jgi:hypothetical protein
MPFPICVPPPDIPAPAAAPKEDEEDIKELISSLAIMESRPALFFEDSNIAVAYPTGVFVNGRKRLIFDILCQAQHRDYHRIVMGLGGTSFCLQARIPPAFLDITGQIKNELDVRNPDTMVIIAATRRTSDFLASINGSDCKSMWTKGQEFQLAFKVFQTRTPRSSGTMAACSFTMKGASIRADTLMELTSRCQSWGDFTILEVQRLTALHLDDIAIAMLPTHNPWGLDSDLLHLHQAQAWAVVALAAVAAVAAAAAAAAAALLAVAALAVVVAACRVVGFWRRQRRRWDRRQRRRWGWQQDGWRWRRHVVCGGNNPTVFPSEAAVCASLGCQCDLC